MFFMGGKKMEAYMHILLCDAVPLETQLEVSEDGIICGDHGLAGARRSQADIYRIIDVGCCR